MASGLRVHSTPLPSLTRNAKGTKRGGEEEKEEERGSPRHSVYASQVADVQCEVQQIESVNQSSEALGNFASRASADMPQAMRHCCCNGMFAFPELDSNPSPHTLRCLYF